MFNVGDRVRVVNTIDDGYVVAVREIGTVIESDSSCPWIAFDNPTRLDESPLKHCKLLPGWREGHMDCLLLDEIEAVS